MIKSVGRRGTSLILFSSLLMLDGYQYMFFTPTWMLLDNLRFPTSIAPLQVWGMLFLVISIIGVVGAFRKTAESLAFSALSTFNAIWGLMFLLGSISGHDYGGYSKALFYLFCSGFVLLINGWAEPKPQK